MSEQIIGAIAVLVLALVVPWYVRRKAQDAELYGLWQERFFQKLDSLIDNRDTPAKVVAAGLFLGEHMREARLLRILVRKIFTGGLRAGKGTKGNDKITPEELTDRVLSDFAELFVAWIHAFSHLSVIHGILFRNIMFPLFMKRNGEELKVEEAVVRPYCEAVMSVSKSKFPNDMVPA